MLCSTDHFKGHVQGASKKTFPGSVKMMQNYCIFLPAVGKQTQVFLGVPCIYDVCYIVGFLV